MKSPAILIALGIWQRSTHAQNMESVVNDGAIQGSKYEHTELAPIAQESAGVLGVVVRVANFVRSIKAIFVY
ncbi:MAG: hypothetical protein R3C14_30880 [Caldilineaceae bacterium]